METIFSIHQVLHFKNHVIRAEKRSLFYTMEYSLIIDNVKQDQVKGLYGILILHGMLNDNGHQKPVKVMVRQTIFTSKFYCKIGDEIHKMGKFKLDEV